MSLVGPGGLLNQLTKNVLETALDAELSEHLGHEHGEVPIGENMRNGTRIKTVLTEIGPVEIAAHLDEVYVSKDTFSRITGKVTDELVEWSARPLDPIYLVIFVDAIVKSLKLVYAAPSEAAAKDRLTEFADQWGERFGGVGISRTRPRH